MARRTEPAAGLLAVLLEAPAEHAQEIREWYDHEHLPERHAVPGFLAIRRWMGTPSAPGSIEFLTLYHLSALSVLASPPYQLLKRAGDTPWTSHIKRISSSLVRHEFKILTSTPPTLAHSVALCLVSHAPDPRPASDAHTVDASPGLIRRITCRTLDEQVAWHLLEFDEDITHKHLRSIENWAPGSRIRSFVPDQTGTGF